MQVLKAVISFVTVMQLYYCYDYYEYLSAGAKKVLTIPTVPLTASLSSSTLRRSGTSFCTLDVIRARSQGLLHRPSHLISLILAAMHPPHSC